MAGKTTVTDLLEKYHKQLQKVHSQKKDEPPERPQGGNLPDGIEGGVAQLDELRIVHDPKKNSGRPYFYGAGVVLRPKEFKGMIVEGLRTSIIETLDETPGNSRETLAEHYAWMLNALKLLGGDDWEAPEDVREIPQAMDDLVEEAPYFRFRTWKGEVAKEGKYKGKEPKVNHVWMGRIEDFTEEVADEVVVKAPRKGKEVSNGKETSKAHKQTETKTNAAKTAVTKQTPTKPASTKVTKSKKAPEPVDEDAGDDLTTLAEAADGGDDDAKLTLTDMAKKAGMKKKDIEGADSWEDVAQVIRDFKEGEEEGEEDEDEEEAADDESEDEGKEDEEEDEEEDNDMEGDAFLPVKGNVYAVHLIDPKTKKRSKQAADCTVTKVDTDKQVATVKNLDDDKIHKDVPFDQFVVEEE